MGVSAECKVQCSRASELIQLYRISKLMGDSFKIYSQALVGHEDDLGQRPSPGTSTPTMSSQGVVESLEMESTF